ncbi:MAG: hypothetical protein LBP63_05225 [Prevotellaceae bacterium]|jgi:hypothetical protein|nr:hypothetical protein [Prevotellaceae bacterium]
MKKIFTIIMLCGVYCGYAQSLSRDYTQTTPPYAASTKTWTFGNQKWSDAIQIPACNKDIFEESNTDPQCRSKISLGKTYYYYNWAYVKEFAGVMCPSPWRVPTVDDFKLLIKVYTTAKELIKNWGYGEALIPVERGLPYGGYWSVTSTPDTSKTPDVIKSAYWLYYDSRSTPRVANEVKSVGLQVRCVCDVR